MESTFQDRYWTSPDGLKLHFRDYPGDPGKLPVLCLHGLTRNARDFELLAEHIAPARRVLAIDVRGRGDSEYAKDSATYNPVTYVGDVLALLAQEGIERFVSIGTSGAVYPAAGFVRDARELGARTLELNLERSEGSHWFRESRQGRAGELVPAWVEEML